MRRFLSILIIAFFTIATVSSAKNKFETELKVVGSPTIRCNVSTVTKYEDQEGNVRWSPSDRIVEVYLDVDFMGGGVGIAALTDIRIGSVTFSDSRSEATVGLQRLSHWIHRDGQASVSQSITSPEEEGTYTWSAGGYYGTETWVLSVTTEGGLPLFGGFTSSWQAQTESTTGLPNSSGSWTVVHKAECVACSVTADTLVDLSPDHDLVTCMTCEEEYRKCKENEHLRYLTCTRSGCDIRYLECDETAKNDHKKITCLNPL